MRFNILLIAICVVSLGSSVTASATLLGSNKKGRITSVNGMPAMCLPKFVTEGFPLAAITVTEGYVDHSEFWGRYLKSDHQPILLKPGECLVLGESLDGYDFDDIKPMPRKLELKPNRTYTFEFHHAYLYATRFSATFCTSPNAAGGFDYLQYVRLPVNMKITPSCDARLNGNAPEPVHPLIYPR